MKNVETLRRLFLIDLYDEAQSDTANYMSDLNDAMLLIKGNVDLNEEVATLQNKRIPFSTS